MTATTCPAVPQRRWAARPVVLLLAVWGCSGLGPPPMGLLTARSLDEAGQRWEQHGSASYHLVVRVRAPRTGPGVYDLVVASGKVVKLAHDGQEVAAEDVSDHDYSIPGLFALLRGDLRLADVPAVGDTPPIDLRASFDPETGRLVRYRRTVGSARRRVLFIEVVEYQPATAAVEDAAVAQPPRG